MKKIFLLIVLAVGMVACEKSPEQRAEDLVTDGIKAGANDPSSVQDVTLRFLEKKEQVDAHGNRYWEHVVAVDYREKNEQGDLVRKECNVIFNEDFTKIESWDAVGYRVGNN